MMLARDVRAMVSSLDKNIPQVRSARGPSCDNEIRRKARAELEEDVADAAALLQVTLIGKNRSQEEISGKERMPNRGCAVG